MEISRVPVLMNPGKHGPLHFILFYPRQNLNLLHVAF